MRRIFPLIAIILLLALPASAASSVSSAHYQATVSADGSCDVTLTLQLLTDSAGASVSYTHLTLPTMAVV